MIGIFKRAIESKERIQIMYMDKSGQITQRFITVLSMNDTHVICYCLLKRQRRMFKIENILSAAPLHRRKSI